jgi:hypothetical protein
MDESAPQEKRAAPDRYSDCILYYEGSGVLMERAGADKSIGILHCGLGQFNSFQIIDRYPVLRWYVYSIESSFPS